uniref:Heart and neural crest derivatives expressed 2 n=1 Tax=Anas platyrhynchos TaxID=8839 RepID=A0A8B9SF48_ANAPL
MILVAASPTTGVHHEAIPFAAAAAAAAAAATRAATREPLLHGWLSAATRRCPPDYSMGLPTAPSQPTGRRAWTHSHYGGGAARERGTANRTERRRTQSNQQRPAEQLREWHPQRAPYIALPQDLLAKDDQNGEAEAVKERDQEEDREGGWRRGKEKEEERQRVRKPKGGLGWPQHVWAVGAQAGVSEHDRDWREPVLSVRSELSLRTLVICNHPVYVCAISPHPPKMWIYLKEREKEKQFHNE